MNNPKNTAQQIAQDIANPSELVQIRHALKDLVFFPRKIARSQLAGNQRSAFRGRGMDFEEVRHYQPGDDVRSIDWRVTARTRTPHTKVFREERERPILVIADLRRPMLFGSEQLKAQSVCQLSTALAWSGIQANDRVGALLFGTRQQIDIRPRRSHHTVLQLINSLQTLCADMIEQPQDRYSLANIIEETRRIAHPGTSVFLVSDFHDLDSNCQENLHELAKHCDVTLCHVFDRLEQELPPPGNYPVVVNGIRQMLNTRNQKLREHCVEVFGQRREQLKLLSARLRMGWLELCTDQSVPALLQRSYGKRRARA